MITQHSVPLWQGLGVAVSCCHAVASPGQNAAASSSAASAASPPLAPTDDGPLAELAPPTPPAPPAPEVPPVLLCPPEHAPNSHGLLAVSQPEGRRVALAWNTSPTGAGGNLALSVWRP